MFFTFRIFEQLALALQTELPWNFSLYLNIFYHSGFEQIVLALKISSPGGWPTPRLARLWSQQPLILMYSKIHTTIASMADDQAQSMPLLRCTWSRLNDSPLNFIVLLFGHKQCVWWFHMAEFTLKTDVIEL